METHSLEESTAALIIAPHRRMDTGNSRRSCTREEFAEESFTGTLTAEGAIHVDVHVSRKRVRPCAPLRSPLPPTAQHPSQQPPCFASAQRTALDRAHDCGRPDPPDHHLPVSTAVQTSVDITDHLSIGYGDPRGLRLAVGVVPRHQVRHQLAVGIKILNRPTPVSRVAADPPHRRTVRRLIPPHNHLACSLTVSAHKMLPSTAYAHLIGTTQCNVILIRSYQN